MLPKLITRIATPVAVLAALLAINSCGQGEHTDGAPLEVSTVQESFRDAGIALEMLINPPPIVKKNTLVAVLEPPDSEALSVSVFRDNNVAREYFETVTGVHDESEALVDSDFIGVSKNVVAVVESSSTEYPPSRIRAVLNNL
jgi:hypothetical protein